LINIFVFFLSRLYTSSYFTLPNINIQYLPNIYILVLLAIVECGRATLDATINMIQDHPTWKARVVYGDTDSVFVLLKVKHDPRAHQTTVLQYFISE